jgi:hypothetical protein
MNVKREIRCEPDSSGSGYGSVTGPREYDMKPSGYIKGADISTFYANNFAHSVYIFVRNTDHYKLERENISPENTSDLI